MRAALIGRSSGAAVTGGDTIQMVRTAEALGRLGVTADVYLARERIDYRKYDLLHFFNILRPADHLGHIRRSGKPFVVSTIYLDYTAFDRTDRSLPYRWLFSALGKHGSEYFKNIYRYSMGQDTLAGREYLLGHRRAMQKVLSGASMVLPNSGSEYRRIVADTGYDGSFAIIPNGIDPDIFGHIPSGIVREDKVLCVAQVYGMKNQHRLIRACGKWNIPLEIIGKAPPNHTGYYDHCRAIGGDKVTFIDFMPQAELIGHYASARVHALPSWFETTGLTSLEAGAMGCNLVVGEGGDTQDYFKDLAWYCRADDLSSIESALEKALNQKNDMKIRDLVLSEYTWQKAAEKTRDAYMKVLHG